MRKLRYTYPLLLITAISSFAQNSFNLEIERRVQDSLLVLDVYIKKNAGADFTLGSSNFDFMVKSANLDLTKAKFFSGDFDASKDPASYTSMGNGNNKMLVMNIRTNVQGIGIGKIVDEEKSKIGSVEIPINNPCATVTAEWVKENSAIHSYFKTAIGNDITNDAVYLPSAPIDLDGGVSKTTPSISFEKGKLVSSSGTNNQWYLDGMLIPGANSQEIVPVVEGRYSVEVTYPCAKNISQMVPITITGLSDFALSYSYLSQPNPFIGESAIVYTLPNASVIALELYDLTGTHLFDLESGMKSQGRHEFAFKPAFYNLSAGMYVAKLTVGDKMGTLKLVAQK